MSSDEQAIIIGPPTHYTSRFDDAGRPMAVAADHEDAAGALPTAWDDLFWDWHPRFDPEGCWVQLVDQKRDAVWAQVKRARETAIAAGLSSPQGTIQIDEGSMAALRGRVLRLQLPGAPETVSWTMADNSLAEFAATDFAAAVAAAEDRLDEIHAWSQSLRAAIFDPANDTLEALSALDLTCP